MDGKIAGICFALLAAAAPAQEHSPKQEIETIVFVCEHGSAKSVIAAAHFNRIAVAKGLPYRAISRGTKPDEAVPAYIRDGLAADGLDVSKWRPAAVTDEDIAKAVRVVSLGTDLPSRKPGAKGKMLEWNDIPSVSANYDAGRAAIVNQIELLMNEFSRKLRK